MNEPVSTPSVTALPPAPHRVALAGGRDVDRDARRPAHRRDVALVVEFARLKSRTAPPTLTGTAALRVWKYGLPEWPSSQTV